MDSEECPGSLVVYLDDYLYPSSLNPSLPFQALLTIYFYPLTYFPSSPKKRIFFILQEVLLPMTLLW